MAREEGNAGDGGAIAPVGQEKPATRKRGKLGQPELKAKTRTATRSTEEALEQVLETQDQIRTAQEQHAVELMLDRDNAVLPNVLTSYATAVQSGGLDDYSQFFRDWRTESIATFQASTGESSADSGVESSGN